MTPCYAIWEWTKGNLVSLGMFGLLFWAWGWPLWPQMCAILKVYFVLYRLSGCAAFWLKYFRSYDREIEFSPKNHPPPIWRGRGGGGRYFPHSYRSEIFWGFLNIYFQIPCAPAKRSDEMMLVGPTLLIIVFNLILLFYPFKIVECLSMTDCMSVFSRDSRL